MPCTTPAIPRLSIASDHVLLPMRAQRASRADASADVMDGSFVRMRTTKPFPYYHSDLAHSTAGRLKWTWAFVGAQRWCARPAKGSAEVAPWLWRVKA